MHEFTKIVSERPELRGFMRLPDAHLSAILTAHDHAVRCSIPKVEIDPQHLTDAAIAELTDASLGEPSAAPEKAPPPLTPKGIFWREDGSDKLHGPFSDANAALDDAKAKQATKPVLVENP